MKKTAITYVVLIAGALLMQACGPSATPEPPTPTVAPSATPTNTTAPTPTETPAPTLPTETLVDMLAWLLEHSFRPAPQGFQDAVFANQINHPINVGDLPEGFIMAESVGGVAYLPDGEAFNARTEYYFPVDGEISPENSVSVGVVAYSNAEVRAYHFEGLARNRQAYMQSIGEIDVLCFYDQSSVGYAWIAGPFLIVVGSAPPADGSPNAWLSIFSEHLVGLYPPSRN
jgi:hypothetical protein